MGMADPANASTTCGTSFFLLLLRQTPEQASLHSTERSFSFPALAAGANLLRHSRCRHHRIGLLHNISEELLAEFTSAGKAGTLEVTVTPLAIENKFIADPTPPGEQVDLTFTIRNRDRASPPPEYPFGDLATSLPGLTFEALKVNTSGKSVLGYHNPHHPESRTLNPVGANVPSQSA